MTPKAQIKKEKLLNEMLSKVKTICVAVDNLKKGKRQSIEIEKILANYMSDKVLVLRICK